METYTHLFCLLPLLIHGIHRRDIQSIAILIGFHQKNFFIAPYTYESDSITVQRFLWLYFTNEILFLYPLNRYLIFLEVEQVIWIPNKVISTWNIIAMTLFYKMSFFSLVGIRKKTDKSLKVSTKRTKSAPSKSGRIQAELLLIENLKLVWLLRTLIKLFFTLTSRTSNL